MGVANTQYREKTLFILDWNVVQLDLGGCSINHDQYWLFDR